MSDTADNYRWRGRSADPRFSPAPVAYSPRPAWIALTVLGFIFWWPLGLALLFYALGSRKMGCWSHDRFENKMQRMQNKMERMRGRMGGGNFGGGFGFGPPTSGNRAFDDYRMETLRRLEDEQTEFKDFLERLRHAKDKEEFDAFMAQHRPNRASGPTPPADQPQG